MNITKSQTATISRKANGRYRVTIVSRGNQLSPKPFRNVPTRELAIARLKVFDPNITLKGNNHDN